MIKSNEIEKAIKILQKSLKDKDYYLGWQANIAMSFKDLVYEAKRTDKNIRISNAKLHKLANEAAKRFLNSFILQ